MTQQEVQEEENKEKIRDQQWKRVRSILRKYSENSLAYLSLEPDKQWFFAEGFEGVASYAVSGHTMVICGDPICADDHFAAFLTQLRQFSAKHRYRIVFLMTMAKHLDAYQAAGFGFHKSGEEAVFDVQTWSMAGGKCAKVRSSWHSAVHKGLTVKEYRPWEQRDPAVERQFVDITDQWLQGKHTARLQFAVGSLMLDQPCDKRYFYAVDPDGVIQGINVLNPYRSGKAWIVDIMRRKKGCPHGVMELLFHDIMAQLKQEGVEEASLGAAPFYRTSDHPHADFSERVEHYVYTHMNYMYGFESLQQAKAKYNPTWQDIYIVCRPKHLSLWMDEAAFAVLDSHGFRDYVQAFLEMRRAEKAEKKKERREKRLKRKE